MLDVIPIFQLKLCVNLMALSEYFYCRFLHLEIMISSFICRAIDEAITKLKARHKTHISVYGKGNERRLTGRHETASVSLKKHYLSLKIYL